MTPEQLAAQFPDRLRSFEYYLAYRDPDRLMDGLREYNEDLALWFQKHYADQPDSLLTKAREIVGCSPADFYKRVLGT